MTPEGGRPFGGQPAVLIAADNPDPSQPAFVDATVLPGRGMMLLRARLQLPSGEIVDAIDAPAAEIAAERLSGGADDFAGNQSFAFGGAILAPYANRVRGKALGEARLISTQVAGHDVRLPRNWGGRQPGAATYAMHGLILATPAVWQQIDRSSVRGRIAAGDFGVGWPGSCEIDIEWRLAARALTLRVRARNVGAETSPIGIGWHPYFTVTDRTQARLRLAAELRARVNNYDEVLPTGELDPVAKGPFDFREASGRPLGDTYLDDCFTGMNALPTLAALNDPQRGCGLVLSSSSRAVRALQVYAPPDANYVVLEPQFNLGDPFGDQWRGQETGMVPVEPGGSVEYEVTVTPTVLPQ